MDARWAYKNNERHFGYKNHIRTTADNKFIIHYCATSANVYNEPVFLDLLPSETETSDSVVYSDSAYGNTENIARA